MAAGGYCEMMRQNGEGIDQNMVFPFYRKFFLFLGTIVITKEAWALFQIFLINTCGGGDYTTRIELNGQTVIFG